MCSLNSAPPDVGTGVDGSGVNINSSLDPSAEVFYPLTSPSAVGVDVGADVIPPPPPSPHVAGGVVVVGGAGDDVVSDNNDEKRNAVIPSVEVIPPPPPCPIVDGGVDVGGAGDGVVSNNYGNAVPSADVIPPPPPSPTVAGGVVVISGAGDGVVSDNNDEKRNAVIPSVEVIPPPPPCPIVDGGVDVGGNHNDVSHNDDDNTVVVPSTEVIPPPPPTVVVGVDVGGNRDDVRVNNDDKCSTEGGCGGYSENEAGDDDSVESIEPLFDNPFEVDFMGPKYDNELMQNRKFYKANQKNVNSALLIDNFQGQRKHETRNILIHSTSDHSFAMFHGVMAGTFEEDNKGNMKLQKYSRGGVILHKCNTRGSNKATSLFGNENDIYKKFETDDKFGIFNDKKDLVDDFTIVGFTAHDAKNYMVHFWNQSSSCFLRARGISLMKFLSTAASNFRPADLVEFPPLTIDTAAVIRYYKSHEALLSLESVLFKQHKFRAKNVAEVRDARNKERDENDAIEETKRMAKNAKARATRAANKIKKTLAAREAAAGTMTLAAGTTRLAAGTTTSAAGTTTSAAGTTTSAAGRDSGTRSAEYLELLELRAFKKQKTEAEASSSPFTTFGSRESNSDHHEDFLDESHWPDDWSEQYQPPPKPPATVGQRCTSQMHQPRATRLDQSSPQMHQLPAPTTGQQSSPQMYQPNTTAMGQQQYIPQTYQPSTCVGPPQQPSPQMYQQVGQQYSPQMYQAGQQSSPQMYQMDQQSFPQIFQLPSGAVGQQCIPHQMHPSDSKMQMKMQMQMQLARQRCQIANLRRRTKEAENDLFEGALLASFNCPGQNN